MDVIIVPPLQMDPDSDSYMIMRNSLPTGRIATKDGEFVEYQEWYYEGKAIKFSKITDAMAFAKLRGWNVVNRIDDNSIFSQNRIFRD